MKTTTLFTPFAEDVLRGLTAKEKFLPSKYFYDDNGSRIFMDIMTMPEYYPTGCELEILLQQSAAILNKFGNNEPFNIIELGSGDGTKTKHLLKTALDTGADLTYIPIDISGEAINALIKNIEAALPKLLIEPYTGDYFDALDNIKSNSRNLLLFLGGNIGNYRKDEAVALLKNINQHMKNGDALLIGMDLKKNPRIIQKAYDDPAGITKAFNLNLLRRINNELDADIKLDQFDFYSHYNPESGEVNSYLVSLRKQHFHSTTLNTTFHFEKDELIWTELSKKYTFAEIEALANTAGFKVEQNFVDCRHYFTDSLWVKK